ncbi:MAG: hypothetical protein LBU12_05275 [Deltaproteobacteria bacterium]|nr:hypothetical protein [Deltaproteobacteria bacterium]
MLIALLFFLTILTGAILLALSWLRGWPPQVALAAPALFLGMPVLFLVFRAVYAALVRRSYARNVLRRERTIEGGEEAEAFSPLKQQFRHGAAILKKSVARGRVPFDVLPWILMLGPAGSGKAEALAASGLCNDYRAAQGGPLPAADGSLQGCSWFFFEKSVYLDVKGLFGRPGDAASASAALEEWRSFLDLLAGCGRKRPLQGVTLTLSADLLALDRERDLGHLAALMRERLDLLARKLDQAVPVYLLVTRVERLPGLNEALAKLDAEETVTGLRLEVGGPDDLAALAVTRLEALLRQFFLSHLDVKDPLQLAPFLSAPHDLAELARPLSVFLSALTHFSPYAPQPLLRGIFFWAKAAAVDDNRVPASSWTLRALFGRIAPGNGRMVRRLNLQGGRRQKLLTVGLTAFYALALVFALLVSQSVQYNRQISLLTESAVSTADSEHSELGALSRADADNYVLSRLDAFRAPFWSKSLGLDRADRQATDLRDDYFRSFRQVNSNLMAAIHQQVDASQGPTSPEYSLSLRQLLWLFSVLDAYNRGESFQELSVAFPLLPQNFEGASKPLWNLVYSRLLFDYLERRPEGQGPVEMLESVKNVISRYLIDSSEVGLDWLLDWVDQQPDVQPVRLTEFWGYLNESVDASRVLESEGVGEVPGVYTLSGREILRRTVEQLKRAYWHEELLERKVDTFLENYDKNYLIIWRNFVHKFLDISIKLTRQETVQEYYRNRLIKGQMTNLTTLEVLKTNLQPFFGERAGFWLKNIELDAAAAEWSAQKAKLNPPAGAGTLNKLESYGRAAADLKTLMPTYYARTDFVTRVLAAQPALDALNVYQNEILDAVHGQPEEAFKLAAAHFGGPQHGDLAASPFVKAKKALDDFSAQLYKAADAATADDLTVGLRQAGIGALQQILIVSAATRLDSLWDSEVLRPVRFMNPEEINKAVYGSGGLLEKFAAEQAAPFLDHQSSLGFSARKWDKQPFPFTDDFLKLLNVDDAQFSSQRLADSYNVTITVLAAIVDSEAKEKPERTTVTYKSADLIQSIDNFNYPLSKSFIWKPAADDGQVTVTVALPSLTLFLDYGGPYAFPNFLAEVVKGELILRPDDFPDHAQQLEAMGVSEIRLLMQADGALPVVRHLQLSPAPLPASIVRLD